MVKAFQDFYQDEVSHCYGCGRLNEHGHQIKSYWDGEEAICVYRPQPYHQAIPGFVYGGLIASIIDCHSTGTAAAAAYRAAGREMGTIRLGQLALGVAVDRLARSIEHYQAVEQLATVEHGTAEQNVGSAVRGGLGNRRQGVAKFTWVEACKVVAVAGHSAFGKQDGIGPLASGDG